MIVDTHKLIKNNIYIYRMRSLFTVHIIKSTILRMNTLIDPINSEVLENIDNSSPIFALPFSKNHA